MLKIRCLGCDEDDDHRLKWSVVREGIVIEEPLFVGCFEDAWKHRLLLTEREIRHHLESGGHVVECNGAFSTEWFLGKRGCFNVECMRDAHFLAKHIASRHLGFGFDIDLKPGIPESVDREEREHANATACVMRAINDGYEWVQTYGGPAKLWEWALGDRDTSSPFKLGRWVAEYNPSTPALLGHWTEPFILGGQEGGRWLWRLLKSIPEEETCNEE